jgi:hypothetical protein
LSFIVVTTAPLNSVYTSEFAEIADTLTEVAEITTIVSL